MRKFVLHSVLLFTTGCFFSCKNLEEPKIQLELLTEKPSEVTIPEGMVWIPGDIYERGAALSDSLARFDEKPKHKIAVDGFFMDMTEVTNAQFQKFVEATGYLTVAERKVDWNELKKQLPEGVEKPHDSLLQPGLLDSTVIRQKLQT